MSSLLNQDIVQLRQQKAPQLETMLSAVINLRTTLEQVMCSPLVQNKPQQGRQLLNRLSMLSEQLANKVKLFRNGVITVSVAGVEKSGKTTLLKNLTGIEHLPTADERCTSVSCEILYATGPAEEGLDIIYYTREELQGVVTRQLNYLQKESDLWRHGKSFTFAPVPDSIELFAYYQLPNIADMTEEKCLLYEGALAQLWAIRNSLMKHSDKLGTTGHDSLVNLPLYASHKTADNANISDLQALIRKITIRKHFDGGAPFLRLCDTPGVDDPNPQALEHTFRAIKAETDLLIIANRPGNMPSITQPLAMFLSNLQKLDPTSPLRERSIFFVNWHKAIDPERRNADIRIQKVNEKSVFPPSSIYGPCDVMDNSSLKDFLIHINGRLRNDVPRQDNELIQSFSREWKSIQANIRTQVLDILREQAPPMPDEMQRELDFKLDAWFDKRFDSSSGNRDETEYFMGCLRTRMNEKTRGCRTHTTLEKLRERVKTIRDEKSELIKNWLKENASVDKCKMMIDAHTSPEAEILPKLAEQMTELVQELTAVAEDIGPVIQEDVYHVIAEALGSNVAAQLCPGNTAAESLNALCSKLETTSRDADVVFITRNLREFAAISMQMRCIMRHELRPALNLLDSFRWHADRRREMVKDVADLVSGVPQGDMCKKWLEQAKLSSLSDEPAVHSDFYKKLFSTSMMVIDAVLSSHSNKFAKLMEDYMADASQTLATQRRCENGWRKALRPYGNIILAEEWARVAGQAANAKQFAELVNALEETLA
ncbi:MAG: dynamin family protein [Akkermansia sp.]|nr:dynamin family protein [Akkermansia sp.]